MENIEFYQEGILQKRTPKGLRCGICERRCIISEGEYGWCRTRRNIKGKIYTLNYSNISSISANPIEKKPLYHFYPGSIALTAGSWGCNFHCPWCQNWEISKNPQNQGIFISPQDFVKRALDMRLDGTSISFNEPTLSLEWAIEVFKLAHKSNLYNTLVTNGYMTEESLRLLIEAGLDAVNIDIKGDEEAVRRYCQADVKIVWRNSLLFSREGVHIEITTLVIPEVNDRIETLRGIAKRIAEELGPDTPWHISRYFPHYKFHTPPTPVSTLRRAYELGKEEGLRYVYIGNLFHDPLENTYCPECNTLLIERRGLSLLNSYLRDKRCPECGERIPIKGEIRVYR